MAMGGGNAMGMCAIVEGRGTKKKGRVKKGGKWIILLPSNNILGFRVLLRE